MTGQDRDEEEEELYYEELENTIYYTLYVACISGMCKEIRILHLCDFFLVLHVRNVISV